MYLARIVGRDLQLYPLVGQSQPRAWRFVSYRKGAAAVSTTAFKAIVEARRQMHGQFDNRLRSGMNQSVWRSS